MLAQGAEPGEHRAAPVVQLRDHRIDELSGRFSVLRVDLLHVVCSPAVDFRIQRCKLWFPREPESPGPQPAAGRCRRPPRSSAAWGWSKRNRSQAWWRCVSESAVSSFMAGSAAVSDKNTPMTAEDYTPNPDSPALLLSSKRPSVLLWNLL